ADPRQPVPGDGERSAHHPGAQQDRSAGRAAREVRRGAGAPDRRRGRPGAARVRQDRRGRRTPARRDRAAVHAAGGRLGRAGRAMIFDSVYDVYRGVVTYVRVVDGRIEARDRIKMMSTGAVHELLELGVVSPEMEKAGALGVGEVGYLITGV